MGAVFCGFVWVLATLREEDLEQLQLLIYMRHF